ncbi:alpha/beta hydrolase (plasmid) [Novosphingobium sp. P6W]|nr:alpha/beta hydrolase [Novosphingobium sp. P6W]
MPHAFAATPLTSEPVELKNAVKLDTGSVPSANGAELWFGTAGNMSVRNTSRALLVPVLPERQKATGAAVVVAPGGAFMTLSWDHEGMKIARILADRGIAAFVLKYRLDPTPSAWPEFAKVMRARMSQWIGKPGQGLNIKTPDYAIADGIAALRSVRVNAKRWHVDAKRVGMIGFSAGARLTIHITTQAAPADRPDFSIMVYPPMEKVTVPADAPPAFIAMATDDPLSGRAGFGLIQSWIDARRPVELHAYQRGGHGFGSGTPRTTTDGWMDGLLRWLDLNGFGVAAPTLQ